MSISLTRTTVYDVDADVDIVCDRVEHVKKEAILAYVPIETEDRDIIIRTLNQMANAIDEGRLGDPADSLADTVPVPNTY